MKKLIAFVMTLTFIMTGCSKTSKSRIENSFEQYVKENFVESSDYKGIASITETDSLDVIETLSSLETLLDSITHIESADMDYINKNLPKTSYSFKIKNAAEFSSILFDNLNKTLSSPNKKGALKEVRDSILNTADSTRTMCKTYILKVKTKGNIETITYYAMDCALMDSILISQSPIKTGETPSPLQDFLALIDTYNLYVDTNMKKIKGIRKIREAIEQELSNE